MKIDPKTITLDANDRAVAIAALRLLVKTKTEQAAKWRASKNAHTKVMDIDWAELQAARATDLITLMEGL